MEKNIEILIDSKPVDEVSMYKIINEPISYMLKRRILLIDRLAKTEKVLLMRPILNELVIIQDIMELFPNDNQQAIENAQNYLKKFTTHDVLTAQQKIY
jgi:hypothetical protein